MLQQASLSWLVSLPAGGRRQWLERRARCRELVRSHNRGKWNDFLCAIDDCGSELSLHFPVSFHSEAERFACFWSQNVLIVKCPVFSDNFDRIWILGVLFQRALQKAGSVSSQGKFLQGQTPPINFLSRDVSWEVDLIFPLFVTCSLEKEIELCICWHFNVPSPEWIP